MNIRDEKLIKEAIKKIANISLNEINEEKKKNSLDTLIESTVREALLSEAKKSDSKKSKKKSDSKKSKKNGDSKKSKDKKENNGESEKIKKGSSLDKKEQIVINYLKKDGVNKAFVRRAIDHAQDEKGTRADDSKRSEFIKKVNGDRPFKKKEINSIFDFISNSHNI